MRRLAKRRGILLGQWGARRNASLNGWALEGTAVTVAPLRRGKGASIALNLLLPDCRGFDGSTVTIDPRGEFRCIAARRRRELGRRVLLDAFGVAAMHKESFEERHLPDVTSATCNPLEFVRDDEERAMRDIDVLLDALLTPPRPGATTTAGIPTIPPAPSSPDMSPGSGSTSNPTARDGPGRAGRWSRRTPAVVGDLDRRAAPAAG